MTLVCVGLDTIMPGGSTSSSELDEKAEDRELRSSHSESSSDESRIRTMLSFFFCTFSKSGLPLPPPLVRVRTWPSTSFHRPSSSESLRPSSFGKEAMVVLANLNADNAFPWTRNDELGQKQPNWLAILARYAGIRG